jgi:hypothetical protein
MCSSHSGGYYITPYSLVKVNIRFEETCYLHLQDRRIIQERKSTKLFVSDTYFILNGGVILFESSDDFHWNTEGYIPEMEHFS